jgi:hypothetical protein
VKNEIERSIRQKLEKQHVCYVLITCDAPTPDGEMKVSMSYKGDLVLASYLIQGAQNLVDEHFEQEQDQEATS